MILVPVVQGTPEWLAARCGMPTASCFNKIITAKTAKPSASAERYLWQLVAERMLGQPLETASTDLMARGGALESDGVAWYELQRDVDTETVGFVLTDDRRAGCSPDRLVGTDGMLEIKTLSPAVHVGALLGDVTDDFRVQCQGQMWVTGRDWVDLLCYHPDLPAALVRVVRDEDYIEALSEAVTAFADRLDAAEARLRANGLWAAPAGGAGIGEKGTEGVGAALQMEAPWR